MTDKYNGKNAKKLKELSEISFKNTKEMKWIYDLAFAFCYPYKDINSGTVNSHMNAHTSNKYAVLRTNNNVVNIIDKFVQRLVNDYTPPDEMIAKIELSQSIPDDQVKDVSPILAKWDKILFETLQVTNFYKAMFQYYYLYPIGTVLMKIKEKNKENIKGNNLVDFVVYNPYNFGILKGNDTEDVHYVFNKYKIGVNNFANSFKSYTSNLNIPQSLQLRLDNADSKKEEEEIELMDVNYYDDTNGMYYYKVLYDDHELLSVETNYQTMIVGIYESVVGQNLGIGPVTKHIDNIGNLNVMYRDVKLIIEMLSNPAYIGDPKVAETVKKGIVPGMIIPADTAKEGLSIAPLPFAGNPQGLYELLQDIQRQINEGFMIFDNLIGDENNRRTSATEISALQEKQRRLSINPAPNFNYDTLKPIMKSLLNILEKNGKLPEAKYVDEAGVTQQIKASDMNIVLMTNSAKKHKVDKAVAAIEFVQYSSQFDPLLLSLVDAVEYMLMLSDAQGIDNNIFKDKGNKQLMQQNYEKAKKEQQQQIQQQLQEESEKSNG